MYSKQKPPIFSGVLLLVVLDYSAQMHISTHFPKLAYSHQILLSLHRLIPENLLLIF